MSLAGIEYNFSKFGLNTLGIWQQPGSSQADIALNCVAPLDSSGIEKRQGYQTALSDIGGYGLIHYTYTDINDELVEEKLLVDTTLHRLKTGTLDITYTGSYPRAVVIIKVLNGVIRFYLYENNIAVLDRSLGIGYDEATPDTLADLATVISGISGFSATVTGDSAISSAFLALTDETSLPRTVSTSLSYFYTEEVDSTKADLLDGISSTMETSAARNINWVNNNGLIVIADGNALKVYDGSTLYYAGLPKPDAPTISSQAASNLTGTFTYYLTYSLTDFQGRRTESAFSDPLIAYASSNSITLQFTPLTATSGYNTKYAVANGSQTPTANGDGTYTIIVDNDHNLGVGDWAYFFNSHADRNDYHAYTITSRGSSSITIQSDDSITIADNAIISNNLQVNIYRVNPSTTDYILIASLPNDPTATMTYTDDRHKAVTGGAPQTVSPTNGVIQITVTAGHTFVVGDSASVPTTGPTISALVVAKDATHISIAYTTTITVPATSTILSNEDLHPTFIGDTAQRRDIPPNADVCAVYNNHLIIAKGLFFYWSDETNIFATDSGFSFNISTKLLSTTDAIRAVGNNGEYLLVLQTSAIDSYYSANPDTDAFIIKNISKKIGCVGPSAFTQMGSSFWFTAPSGVYEIIQGSLSLSNSGASTESVAASSGLGGAISHDIRSYFNGSTDYVLGRTVMAVDSQTNRLLITLCKEPHNNGSVSMQSDTLVYDLNNTTWWVWRNFYLNGGAITDNNLDLYFSSRTTQSSKLVRFNKLHRTYGASAYNDHADSIQMIYETKWDAVDSTALGQKLVDGLKLYSVKRRQEDNESNPSVDVTTYKDFTGIAHSQLTYTFPAVGQEWGFMWNDVPYGSAPTAFEYQDLVKDTVESFKIKLENSEESTNCIISGWAVKYISRPSTTLKG